MKWWKWGLVAMFVIAAVVVLFSTKTFQKKYTFYSDKGGKHGYFPDFEEIRTGYLEEWFYYAQRILFSEADYSSSILEMRYNPDD